MATRFQVLTFNTLFFGQVRLRRRALGEILNRSAFDVICLQEILWRWGLGELRAICRTYPHVAYAAQGPAITGGLVNALALADRGAAVRRLPSSHRAR